MRYGSEPTPYARPGSRAPLCALRDVGKRVVAKPSLRGATSAAGWRRVTQHARVVASAAPYGDGDVSGGAAVTIVASQMARPGGEAGGDSGGGPAGAWMASGGARMASGGAMGRRRQSRCRMP